LIPNYRAIFSNPMAKYCFGAVFIEAVFLFGVFPYMAGLLRTDGVERSSVAGVVIAGFGVGGVIYTFMVAWLLANIGERKLMAAGGMTMGFCLLVIALRMPWPVEFANFIVMGFGFYLLHGCIQATSRSWLQQHAVRRRPLIPCSSSSVRQQVPWFTASGSTALASTLC
jgi:predicted MFS family arabinose efflux permease